MDESTQTLLSQISAAHPYVVAVVVALPGSAMFLNSIGMVLDKAASLFRTVTGK